MANPQRKPTPRKGEGVMDKGPDLLQATRMMNLASIKDCLAQDPESIHAKDRWDNNAMHICVAGFLTARPGGKEIIEFFLRETKISLLQKNVEGLDPLSLACAVNDEEAIDLLTPHWDEQLNAKYPLPENEEEIEAVLRSQGRTGGGPATGPK